MDASATKHDMRASAGVRPSAAPRASATTRQPAPMQRRRAASNYQTLEDQARERVQSLLGGASPSHVAMNMTPEANGWMDANATAAASATAGVEPSMSFNSTHIGGLAPRSSSKAMFELLQAKFGFQEGSVRNQREHFDSWVLNIESRMGVGAAGASGAQDAVHVIHSKFFKNYARWCTFLRTSPHWLQANHTPQMTEKQIALFLLIWGEAGNLRFMPECLCFLFHCMAPRLNDLEHLPNVPEGAFLRRVVRPIYHVAARMRDPTVASKRNAKKPRDHKNVTNYDDINEFFWSPRCLDFDELNVAEAILLQELKTFKERRSFFTPLLSFFRIYFFLFVLFHLLVVIAYVAYRSEPDSREGLHFYAKFFDAAIADLRKHAFCSIFMTVAGLLALKVMLEVWIGGARIFVHAGYAVALFMRFVWHVVFLGIFATINVSPYLEVGSQKLLDLSIVVMCVYCAPVAIAAMLKMCCVQLLWSNALLNGLDGTREQYVGRRMGQSWSAFIKYALFWIVIFAGKIVFNLQLMIKPLIGPSIEIYDTKVSAHQLKNGLVESNHNMAFIVSMWAPVFLVFIYDPQIWMSILQAIVGAVIGVRLKIRHATRIPEFVDRLRAAPKLFDDKVVSVQARGQVAVDSGASRVLASSSAAAPDASSRLRFAVVWNEIISSFRLSDLLDDRETAILQYQISDAGLVEDPVFLIAGQAQTACDVAAKAASRRVPDKRLRKELDKAGVLGCALNCIDISFQIMAMLLGPEDAPIAEAFETLLQSGRVASMVNLAHIGLVRENMVDLLASLLDLPEPNVVPSTGQPVFGLQHDQVTVVVQRVDALLKSFELMLEDESIAECTRCSVFARMTPDLAYQKKQLMSMFATRSSTMGGNGSDGEGRSSATCSNENLISLATRLFFLLTLDATDALPRCNEANRRMSFFLNSLFMRMPAVESIASMHSFSVITPYYNEPVLYSVEELNDRVNSNPLFQPAEEKDHNMSILRYLITFHDDEWGNFLERVNATTIEEALAETPTQVRLWASLRGQTLARTVHGMMMYEDALKMLRWLEIGSDQNISHLDKIKQMDRIAGLKFSYVTSCQIYSAQLARGDPRAADIDLLMRKYPNWRVSYVDTILPPAGSGMEPRYDCVLVKSDGDEIVEVYRYELPGDPLVGEGKPENQNIALPFTRGEYVQTIDMNQEHYFEEALKIPNFLATATERGANVTVIGMKEHIFTGRATSLANFMSQQELVFVSLTQRVLADPLRVRMHYGHPDVFDKSFVMTNGGVSKASRGINLSEDVFSGYNVTLRGGDVTHVEFMQCGKGRDVTLSQINAFEAKLSNGCAESSLSREGRRMGAGLDFFRLNSMFYGHFGFYICTGLTVLCVFVFAYAKVYIALHEEIETAAILKTTSLDDLADVLNTQFIFQFGMLLTIPLMATLLVEYGWRHAIASFVQLIVTLGPVFYIFETGTKSHFYDVAIMRGGSKYRGTGRGFAIVRETVVSLFKEYAASHYRKAVELIFLMVLLRIYGNFRIGVNSELVYCQSLGFESISKCTEAGTQIPEETRLMESYGAKGQDYGVASFAVWLLATCWLLGPFLFNTYGLELSKTRLDIGNWLHWMMAMPHDDDASLPEHAAPPPSSDTWYAFYLEESELLKKLTWSGRLGYLLRELRHPLLLYYVFTFTFDLTDFGMLGACIGGVTMVLWLGGLAGGVMVKNKWRQARGVLYIVLVVGGILVGVPLIALTMRGWGSGNKFHMLVSFSVPLLLGLKTLAQLLLLLHGVFGLAIAKWRLVVELSFLFDMLVGLFLIVPLGVLSAFPFMDTIQTRMMYNDGFSRAMRTGGEFAALLSVLVGLCGGWVFGALQALVQSLVYVNEQKYFFLNLSFRFFADKMLGAELPGQLKFLAAIAAAVGVILGTCLAHFAGRRAAIAVSCVVVGAGVAMLFVASSLLVLVGCCTAWLGTAMLAVGCLLYNFEICMKGWKGKGVLMFMLGSALGYLVSSELVQAINKKTIAKDFMNSPLHNWQIEFLVGAAPIAVLLPVIALLPESPIWLYRHRDPKSAETTLVRLRRKHDVTDELDDLRTAFVARDGDVNVPFRVALVMLLQAAMALMHSGVLLERVRQKTQFNDPTPGAEEASSSMTLWGIVNIAGVLLSIVTVDSVRRKTILKDVLPFAAAFAAVCAALNQNTLTKIALVLLFACLSLSLSPAAWLTALEVFPPYCMGRYIALSFATYFLVQAALYVAVPSFGVSHVIFAVLCGILTVGMFLVCASTKAGAICTKHEKTLWKRREADDDETTSYLARASRSQSFLRSRVRRSSSRYTTNTPRETNYETMESPATSSMHEKVNSAVSTAHGGHGHGHGSTPGSRATRRTANRSARVPEET